MKYIGKYENFNLNRDWQDASKEEIEKTSISSYKGTEDYKNIMGEDDVDFIIAKITDNFSPEEIKSKIDDESDDTDIETSLIDMICWFEDKFNRDILDEDVIISKLREYYQI